MAKIMLSLSSARGARATSDYAGGSLREDVVTMGFAPAAAPSFGG
jgi:hypothetical protein